MDLNIDFVDEMHSSRGVNKKKMLIKVGILILGQSLVQHIQDKCPKHGKTPSHNRQQCPARDATCYY